MTQPSGRSAPHRAGSLPLVARQQIAFIDGKVYTGADAQRAVAQYDAQASRRSPRDAWAHSTMARMQAMSRGARDIEDAGLSALGELVRAQHAALARLGLRDDVTDEEAHILGQAHADRSERREWAKAVASLLDEDDDVFRRLAEAL